MSEGPIKRQRDAWKPPQVTTRPADAVHAFGTPTTVAYCGRRKVRMVAVSSPPAITCSDCLAALRADTEPGGSR